MKKLVLVFILSILSISGFAFDPAGHFVFIENKGQWPENVLFRTEIPGGYLYLTNQGFEYYFYDEKELNNKHGLSGKNQNALRQSTPEIATRCVSMYFENGTILKQNLVENEGINTQYNFYYGQDPSKWIHNARAYKALKFSNVYPNVDFKIYNASGSLKYEYIVHPGGNASQIALKYEGLNSIKLDGGNLQFETDLNVFKEFSPFTYQEKNKQKQEIKSRFSLKANTVKFELEQFDNQKDLIIDPELVFSSFSGSFSDNWSQTATYDSKGNLYAAGTAFGPLFPSTSGAFQTASNGVSNATFSITDVVIMKYSSDGRQLLYATFFGGRDSEVPHSMICNTKDELIVFGTTSSADFPVTNNAFDRTFNRGQRLVADPITTSIPFLNGTDIFVSIFSEDGSQLKGSTFIGGSGNDGIHDYRAFEIQNYGDEFRGEVNVDSNDKIYVASVTQSADFPKVKSNARIASLNDAVVFRLNADVSVLEWSTYVGGDMYDAAYGIRVADDNQTVYVLGNTLSTGIAKGNTLGNAANGKSDAFIAKFKDDQLEKLAYLGTNEDDIGSFLDLGPSGEIYIFGLTLGKYPRVGAVYGNNNSGQFIHCLDSTLTQTIFSSIFGSGQGFGMVDISPTAFMVTKCGNIYVAGWGGKINAANGYNIYSTTNGLPISNDAIQKETNGHNYYFGIFEAGMKSFLYGTYFGEVNAENGFETRGDHLDGGTCRFDKEGVIYHSACVCKPNGSNVSNFPLKNAAQPAHNSSNCNMAAFKINLGQLKADFNLIDGSELNPESICTGTEIQFKNESLGGLTYEWLLNDQVISRLENTRFEFNTAGEYSITLKAYNKITCTAVDSISRKLKVIPFFTSYSADTAVCEGNTVNLFAKGGLNYEWSPTALFVNPSDSVQIVKVETNQTIAVKISNDVCSITEDIRLSLVEKEDFKVSESRETCIGKVEVLAANTFETTDIVWEYPDGNAFKQDSITVVATANNALYKVTAFYPDGCKVSKSVSLTVDTTFSPKFGYSLAYSCSNPPVLSFENLNQQNGILYTWVVNESDSTNGNLPDLSIFNESNTYKVKLKAKNPIGCELINEDLVIVPDADGIIPNAISPNGDDRNETFVVGIPDASLNIFNRWGKLIYKNEVYDNSWGSDVDAGVYYYELKINNGDLCKGWVEVFK